MLGVDDTSCSHELSGLEFRVIVDVGGDSEGDGSENRATSTSEVGFLLGSDGGIWVHVWFRVHE